MAKILKIGIVGCGAIGTSLARSIKKDFQGKAVVKALFDINRVRASGLAASLGRQRLVAKDLSELIDKTDLVIEATHPDFSYEIARRVLTEARDIMILSVGGIVNKYKELAKMARRRNRSIYIPSGALCGLDGLKAFSLAKIKKITLTTVKHPRAFKDVEYLRKKRINLDTIKKDKVLFKGCAYTAVKFFPRNINVAATLSIAGCGLRKTQVRIIASTKATANSHRVEIESQAGKIITWTQNILHPENPKTSYLAVLSAIVTLRQILEPLKVGT
jgi:aspartate dehydrogenase